MNIPNNTIPLWAAVLALAALLSGAIGFNYELDARQDFTIATKADRQEMDRIYTVLERLDKRVYELWANPSSQRKETR